MRRALPSGFSLAAYYQATWWGVLTCSSILILVSGQMGPGLLAIWFLTGLWIRRLLPWQLTGGRAAPIWFWALVSFGVFLNGLWAHLGRGDWVVGLTSTLAALVPLFLYRRSRSFGNWMAFLVLSLLSLISVVLKNSLGPYVLFILYLTLVLFNLNATYLWELAGAARSSIIALPAGFFRQFGSSLLAGGLLAISIFLIFPRTRTLNNPFGWREQGVDVGYTGQISLKKESSLNPTAQLALIVDSTDKKWLAEEASRLYYRGNVLDSFDGQNWFNRTAATQEYSSDRDLRHWRKARLPAREIKIYREPSSVRSLIYPWILLQARAPEKLIDGLFYDYSGILYRGNSERIRYAYDVLVAEPLLTGDWKSAPLTAYRNAEVNQSFYLTIPESSHSILNRWLGENPELSREKSLGAVIKRIEKHFADGFQPSLDHAYAGPNALERFLLYEKKGHCEFFATAAALFLRKLGIPARVALGYRGGTYNPVSRVLEIRESSAHAWVEVYHPEMGWFSFDPTPTLPPVEMTRLQAYWQFYSGAAKFWANRYIVNYNTATQTDLLRTALQKKRGNTGKSLFAWGKGAYQVLGGAVAILLLALYRQRRRRREAQLLPRYYRKFQRQVRRQGFTRAAGETYGAFHRRLVAAGLDPDWITPIDRLLELDLYSRGRRDPA